MTCSLVAPTTMVVDYPKQCMNLEYSGTSAFEWKRLRAQIGHRVSSGDGLAILNQRVGDCPIYFERTVGGDIGWPTSQTWTDHLRDTRVPAPTQTEVPRRATRREETARRVGVGLRLSAQHGRRVALIRVADHTARRTEPS